MTLWSPIARARALTLALALAASSLSAGCERVEELRRTPRVVVLDASAGLRVGDEVRIAGVVIGSVAKLEHRHAEAVVTVRVDKEAPLFADACGIVAPKSSFGPRHLILKPGDAADAIAPETELPRCGRALDLPEMLNQFKPVIDDEVDAPTWEENARSLKTINGLLGLVIGEEYESPDVQKQVDDADKRTKEVLEWAQGAADPVREFFKGAEEVLSRELVDAGVSTLDKRLAELEAELPKTFDQLEGDLKRAEERLDALLSEESRAGRDEALADALEALASVQEMIEKYEPLGADALKQLDDLRALTRWGLEMDARYFRRFQAEGYRSYVGPIPKEAREALDRAGVKYDTRDWND